VNKKTVELSARLYRLFFIALKENLKFLTAVVWRQKLNFIFLKFELTIEEILGSLAINTEEIQY
jgi:hypothetical protein